MCRLESLWQSVPFFRLRQVPHALDRDTISLAKLLLIVEVTKSCKVTSRKLRLVTIYNSEQCKPPTLIRDSFK